MMSAEGRYILEKIKENGCEKFWRCVEEGCLYAENSVDTIYLNEIVELKFNKDSNVIVVNDEVETIVLDLDEETIECVKSGNILRLSDKELKYLKEEIDKYLWRNTRKLDEAEEIFYENLDDKNVQKLVENFDRINTNEKINDLVWEVIFDLFGFDCWIDCKSSEEIKNWLKDENEAFYTLFDKIKNLNDE